MKTCLAAGLSVVVAGLALGCAYQKTAGTAIAGDPGPVVAPAEKVGVLLAADVAYKNDTNEGNGRQLSARTLAIVRSKFPVAQLIETTDEEKGIAMCRERGIRYLVAPAIRHWEEHATNWSGRRDKVEVDVRLLQVEPLAVLRTVTFEAKNNWFTFVDGAAAALLAKDGFARVVKSLFEPGRAGAAPARSASR